MKKFAVEFTETVSTTYAVVVEAENEKEAMSKVSLGDYEEDEVEEISSDLIEMEVVEAKEVENEVSFDENE